MVMKILAFFVITFEPTKIMTCLAPQNDRLNLSLVKYIQVIAQKRPEVVPKWPFSIRKFWETPSNRVYIFQNLDYKSYSSFIYRPLGSDWNLFSSARTRLGNFCSDSSVVGRQHSQQIKKGIITRNKIKTTIANINGTYWQ